METLKSLLASWFSKKIEIDRDSAAGILQAGKDEFVPHSVTIFPKEWQAIGEFDFENLDLPFETQQDFAQKTLNIFLATVFPNFEISTSGDGYSVDTTGKVGGFVIVKIDFEEGKKFKDGSFEASFWASIFGRKTARDANKLRFLVKGKLRKV